MNPVRGASSHYAAAVSTTVPQFWGCLGIAARHTKQTDTAKDVRVAARAMNLGFVSDASTAQPGGPSEPSVGRIVTVPANNRVEVRLPATTVMSGTATFQAAFSSGDYTDAATFELPIWTPATTEAFATYGEVDGTLDVQTVQPPPTCGRNLVG